MTSEVTHLWAYDKAILESEFQHKEVNKTKKKKQKNANSRQNLAGFLAATDSNQSAAGA